VLKGGLCLEIRLPRSARATKDVDLVGDIALTTDVDQARETLDELLDSRVDSDGFTAETERAWKVPKQMSSPTNTTSICVTPTAPAISRTDPRRTGRRADRHRTGVARRARGSAARDQGLLGTKARMVRLDEVANLSQDAAEVVGDASYAMGSLLNRGRGLFRRSPIIGAATKYKHLYRIATNQLIYSKLFGWEGSVGVVPAEMDGCFVSSEFQLLMWT
jgi:hypothetical protein